MPGTEEFLTKLEFMVIISSKSFGVISTCIATREKQSYRLLFFSFHSFCFLLDLARLLEELKKEENWSTIHVELKAGQSLYARPSCFQTNISSQPTAANAPISDDRFGGNKFIC